MRQINRISMSKSGAEIRVYIPSLKSVFIEWSFWYTKKLGEKTLNMKIDAKTLPPQLRDLIPYPFCRATADDWEPFCILAIEMGLMA